ncbi:universal stress protein [Streptomyces luomodiensis]|uniref:Universal stress protein n=1 Tax=Streptomyces luomodiensis TaxID=3026192 RepID=A0ABY9UQD0_9ACTN|nr:universal stress protein [Streptomyces sp. SCA4-21]WNE94759.1 universal stress protein [Streptomyces sp. SCA4-21]
MEHPLVVGVDGSHHSLRAVDWAVAAAARYGVPLRLIHASLWERYEGIAPAADPERPWEQARAEEIAACAAERARRYGPDVKLLAEVLPEDPVAALLRAGRDASGLVTGSRGRGELAGLLLGSVSLALAGRAACPVTVVRGGEPNRRGAFGRIVLGVGETAGPSAATRFAFREAAARGGVLEAVRAWRCPAGEVTDDLLIDGDPVRAHWARAERTLDDALRTSRRDHPEVTVHPETAEGPARKVLLQAAATADLLVLGARRGHGRTFGLQLGRIAHAALHHAPCPVVIVPERV